MHIIIDKFKELNWFDAHPERLIISALYFI